MNWHRVRLDSVIGTIESGSRPKGGVSSDFGEVPSLGGENILNSGGVTLGGLKLVPKVFYDHMTKGHLTDGDVLINKDGAQTGKVGLYHTFDGNPACINEHIFLIRGIPDCIVQNYLYYILLSDTVQNQIRMQITGSAQPGLKSDFINAIYTDIPETTTEQLKIVEILSTVDQAIEQTGALIAKQQRIKTGLMQDLLTRGIDEHGNLRSEETHEFKDSPRGRIPVEWEITKLSSFVARLDAGVSVNSEDKPCGAGQIGVLKTSALHKGRFFPDQNKTVIEAEEARVKVSPRIGTVLISRMNTPELVGESCYVNQNCPYLFLPDRIWMTVFHKRKEQVGKWLSFVLISHHARSYITLHATGTSGSMKSIPKKILLEMPLCAPRKITELVQIGHELEKYESVMDQIDVCLNKLRRLKTALMQDLLTGKVPVTPLLSEPEVAST